MIVKKESVINHRVEGENIEELKTVQYACEVQYIFFFKQKTAYEISLGLVGSEM